MAKTEVYTCDICKESKDKNGMALMKVTFDPCYGEKKGIRIKSNRNILERDICKSCLEKKGFIVDYKNEESTDSTANKNDLTLENKFLDILMDLGVVFEE